MSRVSECGVRVDSSRNALPLRLPLLFIPSGIAFPRTFVFSTGRDGFVGRTLIRTSAKKKPNLKPQRRGVGCRRGRVSPCWRAGTAGHRTGKGGGMRRLFYALVAASFGLAVGASARAAEPEKVTFGYFPVADFLMTFIAKE